ncbi:MAG: hypothetical protein RL521_1349 [Bacteroidota bacterium]|jgi:ring-1,2-phenylacetyl-CoA epoxidase subunit PaaC
MHTMKHKDFYLQLADTLLILGQRVAEWCGHGPAIEEDIALSNISLDYIGQATSLYREVAVQMNEGKTEDDYAFLRDEREFKNLLLSELPKGDYAFTIARQFLFSTWYYHFLEALEKSQDEFLKGFAAKSLKEVRYHFQHSRDWVLRMGGGTEVSHDYLQNAINDIWTYTGEMFKMSSQETAALEDGVGVDVAALQTDWDRIVSAVMAEANIELPQNVWMYTGGKQGSHTESFGFMLAEMQYLQRSFPNSQW